MKTKIANNLILTVALYCSTISNASTNETQVNRLISPSFQELQSEAVFRTITEYMNIPEHIIEKALDKHFARIEYMSFTQEKKEKK